MLGWFRAAAACASARKRRRNASSSARAACRTFTATRRRRRTSSARKTWADAPVPTGAMSRYRPLEDATDLVRHAGHDHGARVSGCVRPPGAPQPAPRGQTGRHGRTRAPHAPVGRPLPRPDRSRWSWRRAWRSTPACAPPTRAIPTRSRWPVDPTSWSTWSPGAGDEVIRQAELGIDLAPGLRGSPAAQRRRDPHRGAAARARAEPGVLHARRGQGGGAAERGTELRGGHRVEGLGAGAARPTTSRSAGASRPSDGPRRRLRTPARRPARRRRGARRATASSEHRHALLLRPCRASSPASAPAMSAAVLADTLPLTLAPSASSCSFTSSRVKRLERAGDDEGEPGERQRLDGRRLGEVGVGAHAEAHELVGQLGVAGRVEPGPHGGGDGGPDAGDGGDLLGRRRLRCRRACGGGGPAPWPRWARRGGC